MTKTAPTPYKYRLIYFLVFVAIFIVGIPVLIFYSAGYTLDEAFDISPRGGIYVFAPEPNTAIYVGSELKNTTGFFKREILIDELKPDRYMVLAANDDYWPWAKFVTVKEGIVEPLFPLLVPKVIEAEELLPETDDHENVLALFEESESDLNDSGPNPAIDLTKKATTADDVVDLSLQLGKISRKRIDVWVDGKFVLAQWRGSNDSAPEYFCDETTNLCTNPVLVFQSLVPIRRINFYPGRNDAIILALDNGIYAVELDSRPYQNFYPLYRGQEPDFRLDGTDVFIKDDEYMAQLDLSL